MRHLSSRVLSFNYFCPFSFKSFEPPFSFKMSAASSKYRYSSRSCPASSKLPLLLVTESLDLATKTGLNKIRSATSEAGSLKRQNQVLLKVLITTCRLGSALLVDRPNVL